MKPTTPLINDRITKRNDEVQKLYAMDIEDLTPFQLGFMATYCQPCEAKYNDFLRELCRRCGNEAALLKAKTPSDQMKIVCKAAKSFNFIIC